VRQTPTVHTHSLQVLCPAAQSTADAAVTIISTRPPGYIVKSRPESLDSPG